MNKILLIEDDPVLQQMYKDKFLHEKFTIGIAGDGTEGVSLMKEFKPDLVLLDLILPTTTGFSVLDIIKKDPELKDVPIIVMTNIYADGEDLVKNHGVKSFFLKSNVTPDEVVKKVKFLLQ